MDTVPVQEVPTSAAFHEIIVQTIDTVRYTYLLNMLVSHGYHTLFTGEPLYHPQHTAQWLLANLQARCGACLMWTGAVVR